MKRKMQKKQKKEEKDTQQSKEEVARKKRVDSFNEEGKMMLSQLNDGVRQNQRKM